MNAVAEHQAAARDDGWLAFRRQNTDLFSREINVLNDYYSSELLDSDRARRSFVLPDRPKA